jgi:outer membrane protein assembly factor BamB
MRRRTALLGGVGLGLAAAAGAGWALRPTPPASGWSRPAPSGSGPSGSGPSGALTSVRWRYRGDVRRIIPDGPNLYLGGTDGDVLSLDPATGAVRWRASTGLVDQLGDDGNLTDVGPLLIYVGASSVDRDHEGVVVGIDKGDGRVRWRLRTAQDPVVGGPVVGGRLLIGDSAGDLMAVAPADGAPLWRLPGLEPGRPGIDGVTELVVSGAAVYGILRHYLGSDLARPLLFAVDAATGARLWTVDGVAPRWRPTRDPAPLTEVAYAGVGGLSAAVPGVLHLTRTRAADPDSATPAHAGQLLGCDPRTGALRYRGRERAAVLVVGPSRRDGVVIAQVRSVIDRPPEIVAMDGRTGRELWRRPTTGETARVLDVYSGTAMVDDGAVVALATPSGLVGFDLRTGAERWHLAVSRNHLTSAPVLAGDLVHIGRTGVGVGRWRLRDGQALPPLPAGRDVSHVVVGDSTAYALIQDHDGRAVVALDRN